LKNHIIKIFFLIIIFCSTANAQLEPDSNLTVQKEKSEFLMQKSPWGAVLRSAIIPGWGQYYNDSYFKIPVIWGAMGSFIYGWFYYDKFYRDARSEFNESLLVTANGNSDLKRNRDFYRDERDLFTIYFVLVYVLNLIDAYVDAHLFDFDVSENPISHTHQFSLRINF
jgi:hypothetical protein